MTPVRVATRGSALALAQAGQFAADLASVLGRDVALHQVTTHGDVDPGSLTQIGGTGVFVGAVRSAVLEGEADVAVHSLKDLPTAPHEHLRLAAVPTRADARDALCARDGLTLAQLPPGARIGTGSPRRRAGLLALRPDIVAVELRGNVDTRLGKVAAGELDAVVLAQAGLERLELTGAITESFAPEVLLPAPGQGALAVEVRSDESDPELLAALQSLDDPATRAAATAERGVLAALEAGCSAPVGAYAWLVRPGVLRLDAAVLGAATVVRKSVEGPVEEPAELGLALAADLLAAGAADLLGERVP